MVKINPIIKWWVTPRLPYQHIFISEKDRPKDIWGMLRVYSRKWLIHPIKRRIAKYYLILLQKYFGLIVVAITGSAGKTTTKEMITSILEKQGECVSTYKNIDPVYNIPTTILKCRPSTKYLVLEMGVEYPGEMKFYRWLAKPKVAVLLNIYPTHTQFFQSVEGVAKEKLVLVNSLGKNEIAILNKDNNQIIKNISKIKSEVVYFGNNASIRSTNRSVKLYKGTIYTLITPKGKINIHLPTLGRQFVNNSLAAVSVGIALKVSLSKIAAGLKSYNSSEHRMKVIKHKSGCVIIDDSYNNNPEAAKKAIDTLKEVSKGKKTTIVFGDMLELGKHERKYHDELGAYIAKSNADYLIGVGMASKDTVEKAKKKMGRNCTVWVKDQADVDTFIKPRLKKNMILLVKGSRSISLDKLVERLL